MIVPVYIDIYLNKNEKEIKFIVLCTSTSIRILKKKIKPCKDGILTLLLHRKANFCITDSRTIISNAITRHVLYKILGHLNFRLFNSIQSVVDNTLTDRITRNDLPELLQHTTTSIKPILIELFFVYTNIPHVCWEIYLQIY